jgi:C_GCAxxG_C_C family probable redox protein
LSFKEYFGYQDSSIPRVASGFGAGIGRKGSICGALTGSVIVIGMKMGRADPEDREALMMVYEKCSELWERFEKEFGARDCYTITGYHLNNPEENRLWRESGGRERCSELVKRTSEMLFDLI